MSNAISELNRMPQNKEEINTFLNSIVHELLEGDADVLEVWKACKIFKQIDTAITKNKKVVELLSTELNKYAKGETPAVNGATFKVTNKRAYQINDEVVSDLNNQIATLKAKVKARETFLKSIPDEGTVDPNTGEIIHAPHYITSEVITCTIKK